MCDGVSQSRHRSVLPQYLHCRLQYNVHIELRTCSRQHVPNMMDFTLQGGLADFKSGVSQDKQGAKQHSGSSEERQALYCAPSYWPFTCRTRDLHCHDFGGYT